MMFSSLILIATYSSQSDHRETSSLTYYLPLYDEDSVDNYIKVRIGEESKLGVGIPVYGNAYRLFIAISDNDRNTFMSQ